MLNIINGSINIKDQVRLLWTAVMLVKKIVSNIFLTSIYVFPAVPPIRYLLP